LRTVLGLAAEYLAAYLLSKAADGKQSPRNNFINVGCATLEKTDTAQFAKTGETTKEKTNTVNQQYRDKVTSADMAA